MCFPRTRAPSVDCSPSESRCLILRVQRYGFLLNKTKKMPIFFLPPLFRVLVRRRGVVGFFLFSCLLRDVARCIVCRFLPPLKGSMNAKSRKKASKGLIKWGNIQKLLNLFWCFAIFAYICNRYGNTLSRTHSCGQLGRYDLSCHSHLARGRYGALRGHTHVVCPAEAF